MAGLMVRPVHHHNGSEGTIGPCQCADPSTETPPDYPRRDRPPPTSYRDEQERWHPGPGAPGYREHMVACEPCLAHFIRAGANGEAWALAMPPVVQACRLSREPIAMPIPGPGMSRESLALLPLPRLEARSTTAGAVGCLAGVLLAAVLPLGVATVVALTLLVATLAGARVWGADRVPTARWLRR